MIGKIFSVIIPKNSDYKPPPPTISLPPSNISPPEYKSITYTNAQFIPNKSPPPRT